MFSLEVGHGRDGSDIDIVCNKKTVLNVELHVRHGSTLMLRNLSCMITDQPMAESLLGRLASKCFGLNTKEFLGAAADRLYGGIGMGIAQPEATKDGKISRVFLGGVFHSDKGLECSSADIDGYWLDFVVDTPTEKKGCH